MTKTPSHKEIEAPSPGSEMIYFGGKSVVLMVTNYSTPLGSILDDEGGGSTVRCCATLMLFLHGDEVMWPMEFWSAQLSAARSFGAAVEVPQS